MKKAQILSAIALAFALGVVAPIAGIVNGGASAVTVGDIQDTATKSDLENAIGNVKNNATYAAYNTMYTATGAGTAANAWEDIDESTLMKELNDAIDGVYAQKADIKPADYAAADTLDGAIENAKKVTNLIPEFQNLIAAIENTSAPASYDTLVDLANKAGLGVTLGDDEAKDAAALVTAIKGNATYTAYATLNGKLTAANEGVAEQAKNITDLSKALAFATDVITPTMIANATAKDQATPIAELVKLANTAVSSTVGQKYVTLIGEVGTAEGVLAKANATEEEYATAIKDLNTDYKAATGNDLSLNTPVTPEVPADPDTDGKGDGATTPDTGVIANSEATATSTASIMAGIATALTAAGVGVVAFRNIRRNKKA